MACRAFYYKEKPVRSNRSGQTEKSARAEWRLLFHSLHGDMLIRAVVSPAAKPQIGAGQPAESKASAVSAAMRGVMPAARQALRANSTSCGCSASFSFMLRYCSVKCSWALWGPSAGSACPPPAFGRRAAFRQQPKSCIFRSRPSATASSAWKKRWALLFLTAALRPFSLPKWAGNISTRWSRSIPFRKIFPAIWPTPRSCARATLRWAAVR